MIPFLLWGCLGFGLLYGFRYGVRRDKELTTDELVEINPAFRRTRLKHQLFGSLWALFTVVGFIGFDSWYNNGRLISPAVAGMTFASIAVFEGFFAARTGIYSVSERWRERYVYESGDRIKHLGKLQGSISLVVCLIGFVTAYLLPH